MTDKEIATTAGLLRALKPGFLPYSIFEQIARLVTLPVVECVPLRRDNKGGLEVLLIERPSHDPFWPAMLHTPGTIVRATDFHKGDLHDSEAFRRIIEEELLGTSVSGAHYIGNMFHESKRGSELAQLYYVVVTGDLKVGKFYPTNALPISLIDSQLAFIDWAAKTFLEQESSVEND